MFLKTWMKTWREGSAEESDPCSSGGSKFSSQHHSGCSQPGVTPSPESLTPSSGPHVHLYAHEYMYAHTACMYTGEHVYA